MQRFSRDELAEIGRIAVDMWIAEADCRGMRLGKHGRELDPNWIRAMATARENVRSAARIYRITKKSIQIGHVGRIRIEVLAKRKTKQDEPTKLRLVRGGR
jgi:hypothetical protein